MGLSIRFIEVLILPTTFDIMVQKTVLNAMGLSISFIEVLIQPTTFDIMVQKTMSNALGLSISFIEVLILPTTFDIRVSTPLFSHEFSSFFGKSSSWLQVVEYLKFLYS